MRTKSGRGRHRIRRIRDQFHVALLSLAIAFGAFPDRGFSQEPGDVLKAGLFAGGEYENYLRNLQLAGIVGLYPWTSRGFSPSETVPLAPSGAHPWEERHEVITTGSDPLELDYLAPELATVLNTGFAYGQNDREFWAGRGVTSGVRFGAGARWGPFTVVVAPVMYAAQNASFPLTEHEVSDEYPFGDWHRPTQIDHPQRPGDGSLARFHPGQSTARVEWGGAAAGISTANQVWGPAAEYPLIVGTNAPGFVHVFMGTARPADVWLGDLYGRVLWGRLEESEFSPAPADSATRFMTGFVTSFRPRGAKNVEVGLARFFHLPWPEEGIGRAQILRPFETLLKDHLVGSDSNYLTHSVVSNQLMSVFGRVVLPNSGFELYGEFATEDHRHNLRDLLLQPDHASAYVLGFRKVWNRPDDAPFWVVRAEVLNATQSHLERTRPQEPFYIHAHMRQGHTHQGQIIGAPAALGGGGATLGIDRYDRSGRQTFTLSRSVRFDGGEFLAKGEQELSDVMHTIGAEVLRFHGRWELLGGVASVYDLNRDLSGDHLFNLNVRFSARLGL